MFYVSVYEFKVFWDNANIVCLFLKAVSQKGFSKQKLLRKYTLYWKIKDPPLWHNLRGHDMTIDQSDPN